MIRWSLLLLLLLIPSVQAFSLETATELSEGIFVEYPEEIVQDTFVPITLAVPYDDLSNVQVQTNILGAVIGSSTTRIDNESDIFIRTTYVIPESDTISIELIRNTTQTYALEFTFVNPEQTEFTIVDTRTSLTEDIRIELPIAINPFELVGYQEEGQTVPFTKRIKTIQTQYSNTSTVEITLDTEGYDEVYLIEDIPKEVASSTDLISFSVEPYIIREDPVIMWDKESLSTSVSYTLEGNAVSGNSVVLAKQSPSTQRSWIPLLVIPVVALGIIFFAEV